MISTVKALAALSAASIIVVLASATACSGSGSCTYTSKCGGDPTPTNDQILLCNNRQADQKCGGAYGDMTSCLQDHQQCLSDGTTDTLATDGPCYDKIAKWQNCYYGGEAGVPDGG
jgi:hypothetical protein